MADHLREKIVAETLGDLTRTHYCGSLREEHVGQTVTLMGWAATRRDLGGVVFIDLRDREGICQVVARPEVSKEAHAAADRVRGEYVVAVVGEVARRSPETREPEARHRRGRGPGPRDPGAGRGQTPPFPIEDEATAAEDLRLKYRYLDLRRPRMHANLKLRHRVTMEVRRYMDEQGFYEIETPMLTKSTPEGARDYLVPSRVHHGQFYALPQSPQIFKQILMVAGMDKYFQIVRCFRDEDLRADRQPEFTQVDVEMSFPRMETIFDADRAALRAPDEAHRGRGDAALPAADVRRGDASVRLGQARPAVRPAHRRRDRRDGDAGPRHLPGPRRGGRAGARARPARRGRGLGDAPPEDQRGALARPHRSRRPRARSGTSSPSRPPTRRSPTSARRGRARRSPAACWRRRARRRTTPSLVGVDQPEPVAMAMGILRLEMGRELKLVDAGAHRFLWVTGFPLMEHDPTRPLREPPPSVHRRPWTRTWRSWRGPGQGEGEGLRPRPERLRGGRGAASGSTTRRCRRGSSRSSRSPTRRRATASASSSTRSSTGRRPTAASPSGSTAWS